jgi:neopullulanase
MTIVTPDWVKSAVFYQIFPDRFARGSVNHAPRGIQFKPWGSPASEQGYQGGDLYGIAEKLDYLKELGVNAIYLNPIFSSAANHRYHTFDYFQVDPLLGGSAALRRLLDDAHERGMKIVLDGVFNHASRGFWPFHHILENGPTSPYLDWFHIEDFPLNPYPSGKDEQLNYKAWWDLPALPKFNTDNPGVRDYLFSVAEYWIDFGIDGWRLDVPGDIDDDSFWQEFRARVKAKNPEAYICGEIWDKADRWLQGDQFDAVMNYPMGTAALSFFGAHSLKTDYRQNHLDLTPASAREFCRRVDAVYSWYDWAINRVQLNLLDSHDMPRAKWLVNDNTTAVRQCLAFLLSVPGAPCIYYGTEVGMTGGNDPHCREAFPWQETEAWDLSIASCIRKHARIRQQYAAMTQGDFSMTAVGDDVVMLRRFCDQEQVVVAFNRSSKEQRIRLESPGRRLFHLQGAEGNEKKAVQSEINLPAGAVEVFVS